MARAATCINHPRRPAVASCYQCHKPICEQCRVIEAGRAFCSKKCASRYRTIDLHYARQEAKPSKWRIFYAIVCTVILLIILRFAIMAAAAHVGILGKLDEFLKKLLF